MKKISIVLLSVVMLFAFTACNNNVDNGENVFAYTGAQLKDYAENSAVKSVTIKGDITLTEPITISNKGFQLIGDTDSSLTIVASEAQAPGSRGMININADNVVISSVNIGISEDSKLVNVIYTNNNNICIQDSKIEYLGTIADYDSVGNSKINQAIALDSNSSASITRTTIKNAVTPIYVSSADVTINECYFNSGIEFERIGENSITNCTSIEEEDPVLGTAKVTVWYKGTGVAANAASETEAKAFLDEVLANNTDIIARLFDGTNTAEYEPSNT